MSNRENTRVKDEIQKGNIEYEITHVIHFFLHFLLYNNEKQSNRTTQKREPAKHGFLYFRTRGIKNITSKLYKTT